MSILNNENTEIAVNLLYTRYDKDSFKEAVELLKEAASEGDADACYFLSRCYMGPEFIWKYAGFETDEKRAREYLQESVIRGSAIGVIGANRISELNQGLMKEMPFENLAEAKNIVLGMAEEGQAFCQFLIGHIYYWDDVYEIDHLPHPFYNRKAFDEWGSLKDQKMYELESEINQKAVYWYERAFASGQVWGADNLLNLYEEGDTGVPPNLTRRDQILRKLVSKGNPYYTSIMADILYEDEQFEEALDLYKRAAQGGQVDTNIRIACMYANGLGAAKDIIQAVKHYRIAADTGIDTAENNLALLYRDEEAVRDYSQAVYYFRRAVEHGNKYAYTNLGDLYLNGLGVDQDYKIARELLEQGYRNRRRSKDLGQIYAYGLGVKENIPKGIAYLQEVNDDEAKQHIANFRKGLFGSWKRRKV